MSWGTDEFKSETSYDSYFTTPSGHTKRDVYRLVRRQRAPTCWPSVSSNVLAVGGTNAYSKLQRWVRQRTAWSDSGGGVSKYESEPSYQKQLDVSASGRVTPDVSTTPIPAPVSPYTIR